MGIETQAILIGHHSAEALADMFAAVNDVSDVNIRQTHRPDYKLIEFRDAGGQHRCLDLFLNSYAGADYADVFQGDTVLVSMEFCPQNATALKALCDAFGGYARKLSSEPWIEVTKK